MYGLTILCEITNVPYEIYHKFWTHTPQVLTSFDKLSLNWTGHSGFDL